MSEDIFETISKADEEAAKAEDAKRNRMELYDWLQCLVLAVVFVIFIFIFIGRTIGVQGDSMYGTLHNRDRVVTSNLFFTPSNNDVIIFFSPAPDFNGMPLVKRVIATAGQTIDIDFSNGDVIVDGIVVYEPFIFDKTRVSAQFNGPITIPEGYLFVMGDNRNNSTDSRSGSVGLVDTRYVLGRVLFLLLPGPDNSGNRDWSRFGSIGS